jgi:hypothetical protein
MLYFFRRGQESLSCETRLNPDGPGFELVVTQQSASHVERFETVAGMLQREHELLQAWRAQGWTEVGKRPAPEAWRV